MLATLLGTGDAQGRSLDAQDLRDECLTLFLSGHETSASALASWGWCMAAHPQAQQRAADEVQALRSTKRVLQAADLPRLP